MISGFVLRFILVKSSCSSVLKFWDLRKLVSLRLLARVELGFVARVWNVLCVGRFIAETEVSSTVLEFLDRS